MCNNVNIVVQARFFSLVRVEGTKILDYDGFSPDGDGEPEPGLNFAEELTLLPRRRLRSGNTQTTNEREKELD